MRRYEDVGSPRLAPLTILECKLKLSALLIFLLALLIASGWIVSRVVSAQDDLLALTNNKASASTQAFVMYLNRIAANGRRCFAPWPRTLT